MLNSSIWRAVLSLFYPPVIIRGKNGKNSENPVGSNKSEKRKPKSAVYRSFWASVVYFHLRLISTKSHKREMTRNQFASNRTWVRIPSSPPTDPHKPSVYAGFYTYIAVAKKYASSILGSKSRCKLHILLPNGISAFLNCQKMRGCQKADSAKAKLPYFLP